MPGAAGEIGIAAGSRPSAPRAVLLAALGGVLSFLGFVGFGYWPLSLICLTPLWLGLEEASGRRLGFAALLGLVFGLTAYAGGFHWIWRLVDVFLGGNVVLGALLWIADSSWFALRFVAYAAAYASLRGRGWPPAVAGVAPLVAIEWLHPMLFPVFLGHALSEQILVVQLADLGGPLLLTTFLALANAGVFETWRWLRQERSLPLATWAAVALAAVLTFAYAARRIADLDAALAATPTLEVGIVQGNLGVFEKGVRASLDHRKYLEQTRELLAGGAPDLVIWPETIYSHGVPRPLPVSGRLIREDLQVPLLLGAASVSGETGTRLKFNSALLVGADGVIRDAYDKNLLIPFTEYVPLASLAAHFFDVRDSSEFTAATTVPALSLDGWRISTPICYEAVRPAFVRRMVIEARPNLIVTLANDSWFGDSQEPALHLAMAKQRAVENRRYLVRATNSGISAVIDPLGREVVRSGMLTRENLRTTVHALESESVYTAWGDWPGWVAGLVTLLALVTRPPPKNRGAAVSLRDPLD